MILPRSYTTLTSLNISQTLITKDRDWEKLIMPARYVHRAGVEPFGAAY